MRAFSWDSLEQARRRNCMSAEDGPDSGFTVVEYAKQFKVSASTARHQVNRLVAAGELVEFIKKHRDARGHTFMTKCYDFPKEDVRHASITSGNPDRRRGSRSRRAGNS